MPILTCTVSGVLVSPDGEVYAGGTVIFMPLSGRVEPSFDGSATVVPEASAVRANSQGQISIDLNPGQYRVTVVSREGQQTPYTVTVPAAEAAFLQDLLDTLPVPSPTGRVPAGQPGQVVGYDERGFPVAVDPAAATGVTWDAVAEKPTTFPATAHQHQIDEIEGLRAELDTIPDEVDLGPFSERLTALENEPDPEITWNDVADKPTAFPATAHQHQISEIEGLRAELDTIPDEVNLGPVLERLTALENEPDPEVTWNDVADKPTTFPATAHGHAIDEIQGLQLALEGKQPVTQFKTVNGQSILGTGNILTTISFATDAEAAAYSTANPGVTVGSTQV